MPGTNFIDKNTVITAVYMNGVDAAIYDAIGDGVSPPTSPAEVKTNLSLDNVDNTSDLNKPVSTAQQTAIDAAVTAGISTHVGLADPHTQYLKETDASASSGSSLVGFLQAGTGAVTQTTQDKLREFISIRDFGAVCDGVTDDTTAVQAAINYCATFAQWPHLIIPGKTLITSSLVINRPVDTMTTEFCIVGNGPGAGFYTTTAINLFNSTISSATGIPVSEFIVFKDITFEVSSSALDAYVLTKKFLRVKFLNCVFQKIKCGNFALNGDTYGYAQSIFFDACNYRYWSGTFFSAEQFFNVTTSSSTIGENGAGAAFVTTGGMFGCAFHSMFEASTGPHIQNASFQSLTISGTYNEGNATADFVLGTGSGLTFTGNALFLSASNAANSSFYPVILGDIYGFSGGNYSNGNLHDNTNTKQGNFMSVSDIAVNNVFKVIMFSGVYPAGVYPSDDGLTAHAGGGQASALQLMKPLNRVVIAAAPADSVKLPPTSTAVTSKGMAVTIINDSPNSIQVFGSDTDTINFIASGTGIAQASATTKTYYCAGPNGRWSV